MNIGNQQFVSGIRTLYFFIPNTVLKLHLDIKDTIVFTSSVRQDYDAISRISYYHFYQKHNKTEKLSSTNVC